MKKHKEPSPQKGGAIASKINPGLYSPPNSHPYEYGKRIPRRILLPKVRAFVLENTPVNIIGPAEVQHMAKLFGTVQSEVVWCLSSLTGDGLLRKEDPKENLWYLSR